LKTEHADLSSLTIEKTKRGEDHSPRRRSFGAPIIIILLLLAGYYFGRMGWNALFSKPVTVSLVQASLRSPSEQQSILTASGYVVAQRKAAVASKATGLMVQLNVKEGDRVTQDQILARLQDNDIRAMLAEAEAGLAMALADSSDAFRNLERQKNLALGSASADIELERAESAHTRVLAAIAMARARLEGVKVALENTIIRAPFDGTVLTKNADVGEIVAPMAAGISARAAVVTIADLGSLQLEVDVSESNIQKIKLDAACEIRLDAYPNVGYPGYVASIIPTADRSKGTVLVKIGFKNAYDSRVLPEMGAKVIFLKEAEVEPVQSRPAVLTIPDGAVVNREGRDVVFKVVEKRAVEVPVQIGDRFNGFTEIRNGLKAGDSVVRSVSDELKNRVRTRIE
jgi:RND family efflux transporter MFP subunit